MKIQVILGSTRQKRFSEQPGNWIMKKLQEKGIEAELLDLRDYPLPFFEEPASPNSSPTPFTNPEVVKWTQKIAEGDGYIFITPEYNHGYSAVLKNALDYIYKEWNHKPAAFISYGGPAAGTRAVQQLKEVMLELQMHPIRNNVHMPLYWNHLNDQGQYDFSLVEKSGDGLVEQLVFWAEKLKPIREELTTPSK